MSDDVSRTAMQAAFDAQASQAAKQAAFDSALIVPTYRSEGARWALYVDQDLQAIFGDDDTLGAEVLVPRWAELMRLKGFRGGWKSIPEGGLILCHWQGMGNLLHWGGEYELVRQEAGPDGRPVWRLVRKEMSFIVDAKRHWITVRVRGLPPEDQAAQYARERRQAALTATLARKARDKADDEIQRIVAAMVKADPDLMVFKHDALRQRLPEVCHERTISQVAPMIADAHHRLMMPKSDLTTWMRELWNALYSIRRMQLRIERETGPGVLMSLTALMEPPPPVAPAILPAGEEISIPAEDAAALAGLAF